ncbi:MAG TPA: glycosyltransferase family 61 protein [Pyrinomonadaceae bacterium]|nr:glycosyltransferase family 61 protein [Pyrinomonadaceae bacterium]
MDLMTMDNPRQKEPDVLLPETVSRRKLPLNIKEADLPLFSHESEKIIPPTRLLELRDVWVSSDGILFKGGRMRPESFAFPLNRKDWKTRSVLKFFAGNYLLKSRKTFEREAVWIVDDWSAGYFHWLADALPRLFTIKHRLNHSTLLLPSQHKALEFVQPTLRPFDVRETVFIEPNEVFLCRKLVVPTQTAPSGHYREETIRAVGKLLSDFYGTAPGSAECADRVYISRSRARKRKVLNEDEVVTTLREFDYKIINAEDYSFEQQVKIASAARYLISNHGAGLTNMLFMRPGGSVLELRHNTDRINNCYFTLASALNHRYFYQTCAPENRDEDPHNANLFVDVAALRANLKLMLQP